MFILTRRQNSAFEDLRLSQKIEFRAEIIIFGSVATLVVAPGKKLPQTAKHPAFVTSMAQLQRTVFRKLVLQFPIASNYVKDNLEWTSSGARCNPPEKDWCRQK